MTLSARRRKKKKVYFPNSAGWTSNKLFCFSKSVLSDTISPQQAMVPYVQPSGQAVVDLKLWFQSDLLEAKWEQLSAFLKAQITRSVVNKHIGVIWINFRKSQRQEKSQRDDACVSYIFAILINCFKNLDPTRTQSPYFGSQRSNLVSTTAISTVLSIFADSCLSYILKNWLQ